MDPDDAARRLSIIRDAIVEAYPGGDAPAIGLHLPPPV